MIADLQQTLNMSPAGVREEEFNQRGLQVYTTSQLMGITGRTQDGSRLFGYYDQPIYYLTLDERLAIFRLCAPVNAVVTSRMNTISAMDFEVIPDKKIEDRKYDSLKKMKTVFDEYIGSNSTPHKIAALAISGEIKKTLPDILPDLSNFNSAALRWHRRNQTQKVEQAEWIRDWMMRPNSRDRYEDIIKMMVQDLMIHGSNCLYKQVVDGKLENVYCLPGGSVLPLRSKFVGGITAYAQMTNVVDDPLIYFENEVSYASYCPTSARGYGFIPLEALINAVAEILLFQQLCAEQADGTRPPEKMVIVTNNSPFGDLDKSQSIPIPVEEQKRIEKKLNTPKKDRIVTMTGNGATIVDISKENLMAIQMMREKDLLNLVGMVFQATPMEMNLAGSDNTSGRETSETQKDTYYSRAVLPIIKILEQQWDCDILPYRFGSGWNVNYKLSKDDSEEIQKVAAKLASGAYTVNEIREFDLNFDPFPEDVYNRPSGAAKQPDGSQTSPFNMKQL